MIKEQEIKDCTPAFYNVIFDRKTKCYSSSCIDGKCICMDSEQAGLLRKLLSEDDQISMNFEGERVVFKNSQSHPLQEWVCSQASEAESVYSQKFFTHQNIFKGSELQEILDGFIKLGNGYEDVFKSIPVIYMINYSKDIRSRDTLINLCVYASCAEQYLYVLFRAVICRTIGCCKMAKSQEEYASELAKLFGRLDNLLNSRTEGKRRLLQVIDDYITAWRNMNDEEGIADARMIFNLLNEYRKHLLDSEKETFFDRERERYGNLYCLLKKILETENISTKNFPVLNFVDMTKNDTEYEDIIKILDAAKGDIEKLDRILSELNMIFWSGIDIPSETIEIMWDIIREE